MQKSIIIVGMGPGVSLGIAEKFGQEGYSVGMISRNAEKLLAYVQELQQKGITAYFATADVTDTAQLQTALHTLRDQLGGVDILQYNAVDYRMGNILDETLESLTNGFTASVGNALVAVKTLLPDLKKSQGAVLLTGGGSANYPNPDMASISLSKAGILNLAKQLNQVLGKEGVYVGTVTIAGWIQPDSPTHSPKILAELFWKLAQERNQVEIVR